MKKTSFNSATKKAILDFGSLKVKLSIFDKRTFKLLNNKNYLVLLGKGITETGRVSESSIEKLKDALFAIRNYLLENSITDVTCIATEAIRLASNNLEIQTIISEYLPNTKFTILNQVEEGQLFFKVVSKCFPERKIVAMDIGGGSVQLFYGKYSLKNKVTKIFQKFLFPTGTYKLQQKFSPRDDIISEQFIDAIKTVESIYSSLSIQSKILVFGSTCMQDFLLASGIKLYTENQYKKHEFYTTNNHLKELLIKIRKYPPQERIGFYPDGGHFVYGSDYLLLNLITACNYIQPEFIYPTNFNSSYGFI